MRAKTTKYIHTQVNFTLIERLNNQAKTALEGPRGLLIPPNDSAQNSSTNMTAKGLPHAVFDI